VFFEDTDLSPKILVQKLEKLIIDGFGLDIKVLLKNLPEIEAICNEIPFDWKNNKEVKSDVMFLWQEAGFGNVLEKIKQNKEVDTVKYVYDAVLWSVMKKNLAKSAINNLAGTKLYK
jgi:uncharacterized protein (DUF1697 family)